MSINQSYIFLIFILNGFLIGILFDVFRILRRSFKTNNIMTYIEDIIFWVLTAFVLLYSIFTFSNGEIRLYMFLGVFMGCLLYMTTLSSYFIKINVVIILKIKKIIFKLISIMLIPFKIIFKPINFITINVKKFINNQINSKNIKKIQIFSKFKKDFKEKSRNI